MLVVVPMVQNMAWAQLVQRFVWGMIVMHGMVMVVIESFGGFEKIIACFVAPLVATQS